MLDIEKPLLEIDYTSQQRELESDYQTFLNMTNHIERELMATNNINEKANIM
jgi:hypothetical protein